MTKETKPIFTVSYRPELLNIEPTRTRKSKYPFDSLTEVGMSFFVSINDAYPGAHEFNFQLWHLRARITANLKLASKRFRWSRDSMGGYPYMAWRFNIFNRVESIDPEHPELGPQMGVQVIRATDYEPHQIEWFRKNNFDPKLMTERDQTPWEPGPTAFKKQKPRGRPRSLNTKYQFEKFEIGYAVFLPLMGDREGWVLERKRLYQKMATAIHVFRHKRDLDLKQPHLNWRFSMQFEPGYVDPAGEDKTPRPGILLYRVKDAYN